MPGTVTPAQMFDHELNAVKGWPSPYAVDKVKTIATGEPTIYAGRVVHIDATLDQFKLGCPYDSGDTYAPMPIFAWPNSTDFDVSSDVGNISGGHLVGLVAVGAYELETTEFVGVGFNPGMPLVCDQGHVSAANLGKVKVGSLAALSATDDEDLVVGIVSDAGPLTNEWSKQMVRFWPWYLPLGTVTAS